MSGSRGEDPTPDAEIDRQFAELVERFYAGEGAQPDDPVRPDRPERTDRNDRNDRNDRSDRSDRSEAPPRPTRPPTAQDWHIGHPLFQLNAEPEHVEPPDPDDRYVPEPMDPMPRLSRPALIGALMLTTAALMGLLAVLGLPFPPWAGWLAISGFTIGMIILLSRLPRHRDPEDGDGAVL